MATKPSHATSKQTIALLQARLQEAEDTLEAIRHGAVDALVVKSHDEQAIFTLRSADYTYRMLIESMNQGALTMNFDGTILYSNKQFSAMIEQPLEKVIGNSILDFVIGDDRTVIRSLLAGGQRIEETLEVNLRSGSNARLTVMASVTTLVQPDVEPYLCVVITDMTERKQAEEAKDEFISLASHQLRTPATSVKQYIHMLIDGVFGELSVGQLDALQKANEGNERALHVIEDLLKVAQIDAGKVALNKTYINLNALLKSIVAEQSLRFTERNQNLAYQAPAAPLIAHVDANLIRMVIENLLDNAGKYMNAGGTVTLACKNYEGNAVFSVADQGVGMTKKDIAKLFQKFQRIPNSLSVKVGGNGLGLYWVKKVIDLHMADIHVSSAVGIGTTFTVTLPRGEDNAADFSS